MWLPNHLIGRDPISRPYFTTRSEGPWVKVALIASASWKILIGREFLEGQFFFCFPRGKSDLLDIRHTRPAQATVLRKTPHGRLHRVGDNLGLVHRKPYVAKRIPRFDGNCGMLSDQGHRLL